MNDKIGNETVFSYFFMRQINESATVNSIHQIVIQKVLFIDVKKIYIANPTCTQHWQLLS